MKLQLNSKDIAMLIRSQVRIECCDFVWNNMNTPVYDSVLYRVRNRLRNQIEDEVCNGTKSTFYPLSTTI